MLTELNKRLESIAHKKSVAFCYGCYREAPTGTCAQCGSDDCMRLVRNIGPEYGYSWIIKHLLEEHVSPINVDEDFEEFMTSCYPESTTLGFLQVDTVTAMKELDPVAWNLARDEYIDGLVSDDDAVTFDNGSTYYRVSDIEQFLDDNEEEEIGEDS